ncbi:MAG: N-acetylneuraminate synthase [Candidatus Omnitrophota bacterium]
MKNNRSVTIGNKRIGVGMPVFIIAEAGVNHNGELSLAKKMVDVAADAGADAVKFQAFRADELATVNAPKAEYQKRTAPGKSQFEMLKELELSRSDLESLFDHCKKRGIIFLTTPFDPKSALVLQEIGVSAFKISSGEITNDPLLSQVGGYGKPIILSTGMSTLKEVRAAVNTIYESGNRKLVLLHCTSNYPARYEDVNLKAIDTLRAEFGVPAGYSDHAEGLEAACAAAARGASVIEKHFTLDRNMPGPDHLSSIEPDELKRMVRSIRNIERSMGDGRKVMTANEAPVRMVARKSVVAEVDIPAGTVVRDDMLALKRPGTGIEPRLIGRVIGKRARRTIKRDTLLTWKMLS